MLHGLFCFLSCSNVKCCGLCLAFPFYTFITWSVPLLSRASFLSLIVPFIHSLLIYSSHPLSYSRALLGCFFQSSSLLNNNTVSF